MTSRALGQPVNPHLFRDAAATFIAEMAPEHALLAAAVLQHRSSRLHWRTTSTGSSIWRPISTTRPQAS